MSQNNEKIKQRSYSLSNFDNSRYSDANDFSTTENEFSVTEEYSTTNEYSADDTSQLQDESVDDNVDPDQKIDVKVRYTILFIALTHFTCIKGVLDLCTAVSRVGRVGRKYLDFRSGGRV